MMVELLGTAHAVRVLASLERLGGRGRFTPLREAAGIGDQQLTRALRHLNGNGFVFGRVLAEGDRAPMEYVVTKLGAQALDVIRSWQRATAELDSEVARATAAHMGRLLG